MGNNLQKLAESFKRQHASLLAKYEGLYIVFRETGFVASFADEEQAIKWAEKEFEAGTFIVRQVTKEIEHFILYTDVAFA